MQGTFKGGAICSLLAVDMGLRTGLALFGGDGRLCWYRSQNFGSAPRLRRGASTLLHELPGLSHLVIEGGGPLAEIWLKEGGRRGVATFRIDAGQWRRIFLYPREQRNGPQAKRFADVQARRIIDWSGLPRPTSLRHDAAEAILVGLWGVLETGLLPEMPPELRRM